MIKELEYKGHKAKFPIEDELYIHPDQKQIIKMFMEALPQIKSQETLKGVPIIFGTEGDMEQGDNKWFFNKNR
jgi:hypothetical protein